MTTRHQDHQRRARRHADACGRARCRCGTSATSGADAYFDLTVDGAELWELNRDGNVLLAAEAARQRVPAAGLALDRGRRGAAAPGTYAVRTREVDTGPQGDPNPEVRLATLVVVGTPVDSAALQARLLLPAGQPDTIGPTVAEIAALPITRRAPSCFPRPPTATPSSSTARSTTNRATTSP